MVASCVGTAADINTVIVSERDAVSKTTENMMAEVKEYAATVVKCDQEVRFDHVMS
jgi:hypothetical protein